MKKLFLPIFFTFLFFPSATFASQTLSLMSSNLPSPKASLVNKYSPNQLYLPIFLKAVEKVNKNNPNLSIIEQKIKEGAATTTDLVSVFLKQVSKTNNLKRQAAEESFFGKTFSFLESLVMPTPVFAAVALPFGGPLVYTFPCTCAANIWMVFIGPTSSLATSDELLNYELGSQAFAYYNIPYTAELLGTDIPPTVPICYIGAEPYCYPVTSEGVITPMVGSSI